jgi:protein transport protein SEC24
MHEAKELVTDFLNKLPSMFEKNMQTGSALGPALQAAFKLMVSYVSIIQIMCVVKL